MAAKAAVLMEMQTGKILWEKNKEAPRPPASTAKILTALVTLDRVPLKEIVTVSITATANKSSAVALEGGERLAVQDLLYALLLQSNNDAALALASHIGGSTPEVRSNHEPESPLSWRTSFSNSSIPPACPIAVR